MGDVDNGALVRLGCGKAPASSFDGGDERVHVGPFGLCDDLAERLGGGDGAGLGAGDLAALEEAEGVFFFFFGLFFLSLGGRVLCWNELDWTRDSRNELQHRAFRRLTLDRLKELGEVRHVEDMCGGRHGGEG